MVRGSQRTRFTGSSLIRLLAHLADADAPAAPPPTPPQQPAFAQRLAQWLAWTDAVALSGALKGAAATGPAQATPDRQRAADEAAGQLHRVRTALAKAIADDGSPASPAGRAGPAAAPMPRRPGAAPAAADTDFAPHRQRYLAHQHRMHIRIAPLRARVREALEASASPALVRLAAVDAVMEQALDTHEQTLLARIPALLERRFQRLRGAHGTGPVADDDSPGHGAWLATFRHDLHAVLLAELDLRLQPVEGLVEALRTPSPTPMP